MVAMATVPVQFISINNSLLNIGITTTMQPNWKIVMATKVKVGP